MITRLTATVAEVSEDSVVMERGGLAYEVQVPAYALGELAAGLGREFTLHVWQYLEASGPGGNLLPRMIGFLHRDERAFFTRFINVKGIGARKALRALVEPISKVAWAIEEADAAVLSRLPGIGKRAADQIIAELKGKVSKFALEGEAVRRVAREWTQEQRDAVEILVALGERRLDAERWLERANQSHGEPAAADEWVKAAYRVKTAAVG